MEQEMNLSIKLYNERRSIRRAWDDTQENVSKNIQFSQQCYVYNDF